MDPRQEFDRAANAQVVLDFFARLSRGDTNDALALMADDAQLWFPGPEGHEPLSKDDLRSRDTLNVFPDGLTATPRSVTSEEDRVVVEYRMTGQRIDGSMYDNEYCVVAVVQDGKVQGMREHVNMLRVGRAL